MSLFTEVELLIMGSVLGGLFLLVLILVISEIISHRKNKKIELMEEDLEESKEEVTLLEETTPEVSVEAISTPVLEEVKEEIHEEVQEIQVATEKVVIEEIEPLIEELEPVIVKIETEEEKKMDSREKAQIELLKVEEELEHEFNLEDTITNLEAIEEENAIISYQELLSNTAELDVVTCDDGDEPITMDEVFKMFQNQSDEGIDITEMLSSVPLSEAYQGNFSETPYLSPINGIEGESLTEIQLENTANLEKLEKEIRKTNEFLNILNELKKNLE